MSPVPRTTKIRSIRAAIVRCCCVLALALGGAQAVAAAALTPGQSPEEVATEAYARVAAGDWKGFAETFDPAALRRFREMIAPMIQAAESQPKSARLLSASPADLQKMSDAELFATFMGEVMGGLFGGLVTNNKPQILGAVAEGGDRTHLVVRNTTGIMGMQLTKMEVVTLHRTAQGWRLGLSGEMEGMAQMIQQAAKLRESLPPEPIEPPVEPKAVD